MCFCAFEAFRSHADCLQDQGVLVIGSQAIDHFRKGPFVLPLTWRCLQGLALQNRTKPLKRHSRLNFGALLPACVSHLFDVIFTKAACAGKISRRCLMLQIGPLLMVNPPWVSPYPPILNGPVFPSPLFFPLNVQHHST